MIKSFYDAHLTLTDEDLKALFPSDYNLFFAGFLCHIRSIFVCKSTLVGCLKGELLHEISSFSLKVSADKMFCKLSKDGSYEVGLVREFIDEKLTSIGYLNMPWCKLVALKVNCFVWRAALGRIPVAKGLMDRSVNIDASRCRTYPIAEIEGYSTDLIEKAEIEGYNEAIERGFDAPFAVRSTNRYLALGFSIEDTHAPPSPPLSVFWLNVVLEIFGKMAADL
ncbi:hypothetical protein L2E82_16808 [Cichorium intybus]|uniref:Uncharacterized protein n=1 Tax=Cichorium intybus TaxID=13427 RepID=A0ACB9F7V6_CICIN|nr:hypothetical protein L2E82_16808 [Cichorium intybus]